MRNSLNLKIYNKIKKKFSNTFYYDPFIDINSSINSFNENIIKSFDVVLFLSNGTKFKKLYDNEAKASYLWNAEDRVFISYETPKEIKLKSEFIKQQGLGGAMFWEYSLDNNKELLEQLFESIKD